MRRFVIAAVAALVAAPAAAQQKIDFILNWVPGGDHAPYYYAKKLGWYQKEGIDLNLEPGKGSALATQKVGAGANPVGSIMRRNVKPRAWRAERLKDDTHIPTASEKNNAFTTTNAILPNSPGVTPPINNGTAITGTTASTP